MRGTWEGAGDGERAGTNAALTATSAERPQRPMGPIGRFRSVTRLVGENTALSRLQGAFLVMTLAEYGEWITLLVYAYKQGVRPPRGWSPWHS